MTDLHAETQMLGPAGSAPEVVIALQTVVLIAVGIHMIFYGRPGLGQEASHAISVPQPSGSKANSPGLDEVLDPVLAMLQQGEGRGPAELANVLFEMLIPCGPDTVIVVLTALLETAGREASIELLAVVRETLAARGLRPSVRMGELLLQGYLGFRLRNEFDEVLAEIKSPEGALPSIKAVALNNLW
mmetsp:Transcript_222/g.452  ORF Transcript_222/g.452 Transcript_222/m.452 type:complete len:187 (+) Transcript_222:153-713(+)